MVGGHTDAGLVDAVVLLAAKVEAPDGEKRENKRVHRESASNEHTNPKWFFSITSKRTRGAVEASQTFNIILTLS